METPPPGSSATPGRSGGETPGGETGAARASAAAAHDPLDPRPNAAAEVQRLEREAAAVGATDKRRAAQLLHEVARLVEGGLGDERRAARTYAQSLTADPTFQPNAWALRRIFWRRGFWDNLMRVLDAEARFAPGSDQAERADLLVEKARVLEARLGRGGDGRAALNAALELAPDHAGALALVLLASAGAPDGAGGETQPARTTDEVLATLANAAPSPQLKAAFAIALARRTRAAGGPEAVARAADQLHRAIAAGADAWDVLGELDRLSLSANRPDLRLRVLDAFESHFARHGAREPGRGPAEPRSSRASLVALAREKARLLLRRGVRDGALAVLERASREAPSDPLLFADFLEAAELAGRADAVALHLDRAEEDGALPPGARAEAALRQAELAVRAGALGEAMEALRAIGGEEGYARLAGLLRVRVSAALQDGAYLAEAFEREAEEVAADPDEAAHQLVRAGTVREVGLADSNGGEALYRRALARVPGHRPALEGLAAVYTREGRWADLVGLLSAELAAETDSDRALALRESLALIARDVLLDPTEALAHGKLLAEARGTLRELVRLADLAGWATTRRARTQETAAPHAHDVDAGEAMAAVLAATVDDGPAAAGLHLLVGRAAAARGRELEAEAAFRKSFGINPTQGAAAALEERYAATGRSDRLTVTLGAELRAAESETRTDAKPDRARAIRFRLAAHASAEGRWDDALAALEPLRRMQDPLAVEWSIDLARLLGTPKRMVDVLVEAGVRVGDEIPNGPGELARALRLAEALLADGRRDDAHLVFEAAAAAAPDVARALDAGIGVLRCRLASDDGQGVLGALEWLSRVAPGEDGANLAREALLSAVAAGVPFDETARDPGDPVFAFCAGASAHDDDLVLGARATLASWLLRTREADGAAAELDAAVGVRRTFAAIKAGKGASETGAAVLAEAAAAGQGLAVIAATDLVGADAPLGLRIDRARAHADRGRVDLAVALLIEEASAAIGAGRRRHAADALAQALALDPGAVDALERFRQLASAAGDRKLEARLLARLGERLRAPLRAAQAFAEAALLLEAEGDLDGAADLFLRVLGRTPEDEEAYHRLRRLLTKREDWSRLEGLLSWKLSQLAGRTNAAGPGRVADPLERAALYHDRAQLRLEKWGSRDAAIDDWKRAIRLAPRRFDSLLALGRLAVEDGRGTVAVGLLERALPEARTADDEATCRRLLAGAHEREGNLASAAAVLTALLAQKPDDVAAREQLVALAVRQGDFGRAVEQLRALAERAADASARAALELRLGKLARDQMGQAELALSAFRRALELDPLGEAASELAVLVPRYTLPPRAEKTAIDRVLATLREHLATVDPLDVVRLERVAELARVRGRAVLAGAAGQTLRLLGAAGEHGKARDLRGELPVPALLALGHLDEPGPSLFAECWEHVAGAFARHEAPDPAELGVSKHTRLEPGEEPRLGWVEAAARAVGLEDLALYLSNVDERGADRAQERDKDRDRDRAPDRSVIALELPQPTLVLGRGALGGDPAARFRVGRAIALLRLRATAVARLDEPALAGLWSAAAALAGATEVAGLPAVDRAAAKALAKDLSRRDLRALQAFARRFSSEPLDVSAWRRSLLRAAERFGLLLAGDLAEAVRALIGQSSPSAADVRASRPALELVRFALDDGYDRLRRDVGLVEA